MQMNAASHIAGEVRAELARQRRTQRDVAELLGISSTQVGMRLEGKVDWRISELISIAEFLAVPLTNFLPIVVAPERAA